LAAGRPPRGFFGRASGRAGRPFSPPGPASPGCGEFRSGVRRAGAGGPQGQAPQDRVPSRDRFRPHRLHRLFVGDHDLGRVPHPPELHGDDALLRRLPREPPGVDQPVVRLDDQELAGDDERGAALLLVPQAEPASDLQVDLGEGGRPSLSYRPPLLQLRGVRPRAEDPLLPSGDDLADPEGIGVDLGRRLIPPPLPLPRPPLSPGTRRASRAASPRARRSR